MNDDFPALNFRNRISSKHVPPPPDLKWGFASSGKMGKNGEGEFLVIENYKYRMKVRANKRRYWECTTRRCTSKAITEGDVLISYYPEHFWHDNPGCSQVRRSNSHAGLPTGASITKLKSEDVVQGYDLSRSAPDECITLNGVLNMIPTESINTNHHMEEYDPENQVEGNFDPPMMTNGSAHHRENSLSSLYKLPKLTPYTPEISIEEEQASRNDSVLLEPFNYIRGIPGKNIRSKLSQGLNYWLKIPHEKLDIISNVIEMLHNASLVIDDIEDNSCLRRGQPSAHKMFGVALSINSANYVYFLALQKLFTLGHPDAVRVYTHQMLELHRGQGLDIYWRDSYVCPSEEEYKQMVIQKTGGLFGMSVQLMQLFSRNKNDLTPLTNCLGLLFQIRDDYANLIDKSYHDSKTYCEDLTEGKYSFPIVHAICQHPTDHLVSSVLRQRTQDLDVKRRCVTHLHKLGSLEYTRQTLLSLDERASDLIEEHGGNEHLSKLLQLLRKVYESPIPSDFSC